MADQHSSERMDRPIVAIESSKSTITDPHPGEQVSTTSVPIASLESTNVANQHHDKDSTTTNVANQHPDKDSSTTNDVVGSLESIGLTNQDRGKDLITANVVVGSMESTCLTNQDSGKNSSIANVSVESMESSGLTNQDSGKGSSISNVTIKSLDSTGIDNQDHGKDLNRVNKSVRTLEFPGEPDQHSDEGVSIADVARESLKSKAVVDKNSDEGAVKTNGTIEHSESSNSGTSMEINIKTLDEQLHGFNVDKNIPVSTFKEKIASEIGLPVEQQRLIFRGKVLKDEDLLSEYHVESGHTLHLVSRQLSEFQPLSRSPNTETTARSGNTGEDTNVTSIRPHVGHVSHNVVLGTFGVGDQDVGSNPDVNQVIGAVLNSFGIGAEAPVGSIGVGHPNMQLSIPVHVAQGNETRASVNNHDNTGSQSHGLRTHLGAAPDPIPDSLYTLSEFMNHMERVLSQNEYHPSVSNSHGNSTQDLSALQLPSNAHGLLSPAALAVVMRHAQRLLIGPVARSLSHTARRLEEEEGSTGVTVRTMIHTEAMQSGLAMQHLGALFLELGRTMLTLRIGQSSAESFVNVGPAVYISPSFVNVGPAVYISPSGPNPIMVQPFPLQTHSLFDSEHTPTVNHGAFGHIGVGTVPQHLNIHIHAGVGPRATNVEPNQEELTNRNGAGVNSQTRGVGDNMIGGNQVFDGQINARFPPVRTDTRDARNVGSINTRNESLSETEAELSSSRRSNITTPKTASAIPLGLGQGGLQPKRQHQHTRAQAGSSGASTSFSNQSLTSAGGELDPVTIMNQFMQNPALNNMLTSVSNQNGSGSSDFLRNLLSQLAQNPAMMNTVNQLAQQIDGNQDLGSMGGGNIDMSNMVQQMMPFVSQALNRGTSTSNLPKPTPSRKGTLHRRYSSVKSLNIKERPSDFQMNLENAAQKIVEQYPPLEIFSSIVETVASLHNNVYDTIAIDELCMEEELAQEFVEMLKRDISQRLKGGR